MPDNLGPMVSRRQLGVALRQYRLDAGKTVGQAAEHLMCHPSKITRMEKAQRTPSPRDVRDLAEFYGIEDESARDRLMRLARESRESAWWQNLDLSPTVERFFGLEGSATKISDYQIAPIPGLLQTRDYADAMMRAWAANDPAIKEAVDIRMMRQEYLAKSTQLHLIVDEAAVRRVVGSVHIMRDQIVHLIQLTTASRVKLQVIPFARGAHRGMMSGFTVLQFESPDGSAATPAMSDVVFIEGLVDGIYLDRPEDVKAYLQTFDELQGVALTVEETLPFLEAVHDSYRTP